MSLGDPVIKTALKATTQRIWRCAGPFLQVLCSGSLLWGCGNGPEPIEADVIVRHVNVVDVVTGTTKADQVVLVNGERIAYVGDDADDLAVPASAYVIDGTAHYLIPGLWDMHVHVCWSDTNAELLLPTLLAHGITGVRDMGGDLGILNAFKHRVAEDPSAGPDVIGCGPIIDGDPPVFADFTLPTSSTTDLGPALDSLAAGQVDFLKVYSLLPPEALERIAAYSKAHGIPFAGHLSEYVEPEQAIALGQRSIEHLNRLEELWDEDEVRADTLLSLMLRAGTWSCPTLIIYQRKSHLFDPTLRDTVMDRLLPGLQSEWADAARKRTERYGRPRQRDSLEQRFQRELALVRHLHERGVPILAGTDLAGMAFIYPGTGLVEELELLTHAGLSNTEALQAATLAPARYLGMEADRGSIASGKLADLVLLTADPLSDIGHVRRVAVVLHRGRIVAARR